MSGVPGNWAIGIMASRIAVGVVAAFALWLCFLSMRDVPHNTMIRNPQPSLTILWTLVALIVAAGALALIRSSRRLLLRRSLRAALVFCFP
jgi:hypothetical protein